MKNPSSNYIPKNDGNPFFPFSGRFQYKCLPNVLGTLWRYGFFATTNLATLFLNPNWIEHLLPPFWVACCSLVLDVEESVEAGLAFQAHLLVYLTIILIMVIVLKNIANSHLSRIELVAHYTVALWVESCSWLSRRVIKDLVRRRINLFVLSARLETTLQEKQTQGNERELPSSWTSGTLSAPFQSSRGICQSSPIGT